MLSCTQSISVVEKRELRDVFLLLKEDLTDEDIPKRDKMRQLVMDHYGIAYDILKEDLRVRVYKAS